VGVPRVQPQHDEPAAHWMMGAGKRARNDLASVVGNIERQVDNLEVGGSIPSRLAVQQQQKIQGSDGLSREHAVSSCAATSPA